MLQFLRFDKSTVERAEFPVISGSESFKFFARRTGYLLILIYSGGSKAFKAGAHDND